MANPQEAQASTDPTMPRVVLALLSRRVLPVAVLIFCLACCAGVLAELGSRLFMLGEAGPGDLYVFHTIRKFQATGMIYQRSAEEPSPVYGPMLYTLLAVPGRFMKGNNPLLGIRLIEVSVFLLCVVVIVSITRALMPHRKVWLWSLPLSLAFAPMLPWILRLRGDFLSILFGLIALRLLLTRQPGLALLAGASAGFALQFKVNYIAALVAGALWLMADRRWKAFGLFALGSTVTFIGIYIFYTLREPRMAGNMLAMKNPLLDYAGDVRMILHLANEPIALLGLSVIPFLRWRPGNRWMLLVLYSAVSFAIAALLDLQVGGAENYFFEFLFSLAPFAALAMLKLGRWRLWDRWTLLVLFTVISCGIAVVTELPPGLGRYCSFGLLLGLAALGALKRWQPVFAEGALILSALLLICLAAPVALSAYTEARTEPARTRVHNLEMTAFQSAVRDQSVLTFVPGLAFFTPDDFLPDPWGLSYGELMGTFDYHPLAGRIRAQKFDLIVTPRVPDSHRGLELLSPTLRPAITEAYQPFCSLHNWVMFLRRNSAGQGSLGARLVAMGCDAASCLDGPYCRSW